MGRRNLLAHLVEAAGQRWLNHHGPDARLGGKREIGFAQALIPGNGNAGFPGEGARVVARFARLFEKRDAAAVRRVDVLRKLLRPERRPGAVGVQAQV